MNYLYLLFSILFNVSSYVLYRGIAQKPHTMAWYILFFTGLTLGAVNVLFFTKSLQSIALNVAYPVFSGSCIFAIALISIFIFGEKLSIHTIVGTTLVIMGIVFLTV